MHDYYVSWACTHELVKYILCVHVYIYMQYTHIQMLTYSYDVVHSHGLILCVYIYVACSMYIHIYIHICIPHVCHMPSSTTYVNLIQRLRPLRQQFYTQQDLHDPY